MKDAYSIILTGASEFPSIIGDTNVGSRLLSVSSAKFEVLIKKNIAKIVKPKLKLFLFLTSIKSPLYFHSIIFLLIFKSMYFIFSFYRTNFFVKSVGVPLVQDLRTQSETFLPHGNQFSHRNWYGLLCAHFLSS